MRSQEDRQVLHANDRFVDIDGAARQLPFVIGQTQQIFAAAGDQRSLVDVAAAAEEQFGRLDDQVLVIVAGKGADVGDVMAQP